MRALRFFDGLERVVAVVMALGTIGLLVFQLFEQPEAEASSDHRSRGEYAASVFAQAFQPSA